ncbi:MAG TPA: hypothetical protein VHO05_17370 [Hyphomicrobium sp.]|nr:hypothetical protein [Hyphomicrobium sp.]
MRRKRDTNSPAPADLIGSVINFVEVRFRVMGMGTRGIRIVSSFAALCVLATAGAGLAGDGAAETAPAPEQAAVDISGRWEGRTYEIARRGPDCGDKPCTLTLDVARCATGWCGVEVTGSEQRCGDTALKLDAGDASGSVTLFKGKLELAKGTEPYVVEAYLVNMSGDTVAKQLQIAGDTGGEFRMFRRTFPFNATLARSGEARCKPETTVSALE